MLGRFRCLVNRARREMQRPSGQLAMIEPRGAVHLRESPGEPDPEAPGVGAPAPLLEPALPWPPPWSDALGYRFDDEKARTAPSDRVEPHEEAAARTLLQLVEGEGGDDGVDGAVARELAQ